MNRLLAAAVLATTALWLSAPANASVPPPLPKANSSFDSGSLHVDVYGTPGKPALVFIPGLTCGPWEWSGEIARYSPSYEIYALTLPGFDGRPPITTPLFQTVTSDFWSMLSTHKVQRPVVIGHSLGGTLAILLAEQHSEQLRGAIAVDGLPVFPGLDKMTPQQRAQIGANFSAMFGKISSPAQFEAIEKSYVLSNYLTSPVDVDAVAPLVARSDPQASGAWMAADVSADNRAGLKNIRIPVLEIAPYDSTIDARMFPSAAAKQSYYASLLADDPTAKVEMVAPSRHFEMYDQPQRLDADITAFLQALP